MSKMSDAWNGSVEIAADEAAVLKLCKKQVLWGFLRHHRHEILDDEVRAALERMYACDDRGGRPPVAPERLLLAMLLQVCFGVADHEVPTLTAVDRRWQMILDLMGAEDSAFSQGTVFSFRERARKSGLMELLLRKTIELARSSKGFDHKRLRAIFDSSPLVGAGRVEDTFNLLGRAISELIEAAASERALDPTELAKKIDVPIFGASSVKALLDVDWRDPSARSKALYALLEQFDRLRGWLEQEFGKDKLEKPPLSVPLATVEKLIAQDTEPDPDAPGRGTRRIREGVAKDRMPSLSDRDMRHGRKSKTKTFTGYKRHVAVDADVQGLICGVEVQAANKHEHEGAAPLMAKIAEAGYELDELQIDRGYLPSAQVVAKHEAGLKVVSKPPTPIRGDVFTKDQFSVDFDKETITCPAGISMPLRLGKTVYFPITECCDCRMRDRCTTGRQRGVNIHPQERWYREMANELATKQGRAQRRERIAVEHTLARISAIQGNRARFRGLEKNQFDLERAAIVNNCYVLNGLLAKAA